MKKKTKPKSFNKNVAAKLLYSTAGTANASVLVDTRPKTIANKKLYVRKNKHTQSIEQE